MNRLSLIAAAAAVFVVVNLSAVTAVPNTAGGMWGGGNPPLAGGMWGGGAPPRA